MSTAVQCVRGLGVFRGKKTPVPVLPVAPLSGSARDLRGNGAEATLAHLELCERAQELLLGELRPHAPREVELGVRAFPEEEIAEALFAAGADEEIDVADRE